MIIVFSRVSFEYSRREYCIDGTVYVNIKKVKLPGPIELSSGNKGLIHFLATLFYILNKYNISRSLSIDEYMSEHLFLVREDCAFSIVVTGYQYVFFFKYRFNRFSSGRS